MLRGEGWVLQLQSSLVREFSEKERQGGQNTSGHAFVVRASQVRKSADLAEHQAPQPQYLGPDHKADVQACQLTQAALQVGSLARLD